MEILSLTESINKRFVGSFVSHRVHGIYKGLSANVLRHWEFYLSQIFTEEQKPIC